MTRRLTAPELTRLMHQITCMGVGDYCDGGDHLKTFRASAREVAAADDQALALHDYRCPLHWGQKPYHLRDDPEKKILGVGCPERERHAAEMFAPLIEEWVEP